MNPALFSHHIIINIYMLFIFFMCKLPRATNTRMMIFLLIHSFTHLLPSLSMYALHECFFFQVQYILSDGSILVQQKEVKKDSNKNNYRRMIVVNQQDLTPSTTTTTQVPVTQQRIVTQQIPSNGNVETKGTIVTSSVHHHHQQQQQQQHSQTQQQQRVTVSQQQQQQQQAAMTPLGPLTLTAEEYNELMQRRIIKQAENEAVKAQHEAQERAQQEVAMAAAQQRAQQEAQQRAQQQLHHQQLHDHQNITMQVQKIVQSLEDDVVDDSEDKKDDEDIEMQMIVPKLEVETVKIEEGTSSDKQPTKNESTENSKTAGRPFTCEQCGKKFLLKHHLTTHARVHSGMQMNIFV